MTKVDIAWRTHDSRGLLERRGSGPLGQLPGKIVSLKSAYPNRIQTIDKLIAKEKDLLTSYHLCKQSEESADHILVQCQVVKKIWNIYLASFTKDQDVKEALEEIAFGKCGPEGR